jgi:hypothetical protein
VSGSSSTQSAAAVTAVHSRGCRCVKSQCQQKYCECFQNGVTCTDKCTCVDCKNQSPSQSRKVVII